MALNTRDQYLKAGIDSMIARTPISIRNEGGFDFTPGSPLRAFMEGQATMLALATADNEMEFYRQAREAMFVIAGVDRIPPTKATGHMNITAGEALTIPAGTSVYHVSGEEVAKVIHDAVFTSGQTKNIAIMANDAGADFRVEASTLFLTVPNTAGTNLAAIANGKDEEQDHERLSRFRRALLAKTNGTAGSLLSGMQDIRIYDDVTGHVIETVRNAVISMPWQHDPEPPVADLGKVTIYLLSTLRVPSDDLIAAAEAFVAGKTGAGQAVEIRPVETVPVSFSVSYYPMGGYNTDVVTLSIQSAITEHLNSLVQGQPLNPTQWQAAIAYVPGVLYYDELTLEPSEYMVLNDWQIWDIDSITVTVL